MTGRGRDLPGRAATHSSRHRPQKRATQYSAASVIKPKGRGVLDPRVREDDRERRGCLTGSHTLQPSSPAKAGDPVFRGVSDRPARPRRTGSPAFAEDDRERRGCPTGKSAKSCPAQLAKIFRFALDPNHFYKPAVSRSLRGAYHDRHERWRGMRWTRAVSNDDDTGWRTAKPCGPGAPTLASSLRGSSARRRWQTSPVTGESAE